MINKGKVYIIGAGPGDPQLITYKGFEILKSADVVLYDRLANSELLQLCKSDAELIFVGKEQGLHYVKQEDTIKILIDKANDGNIVVRLKGGDPFIFGRGAEEALELSKNNIEYEIIPGITAAIGASGYSGIPLTHRNLVTQCLFITAHESPEKENSQIDWKLIAQMKNTSIAIYMGTTLLPAICETLIKFGMNPESQIALIENATLKNQRIITGNLTDISQKAIENNIKPPVITLISPSVELRDDIKWIEKKRLHNKRIVTTRAYNQSESLFSKLEELGAEIIPFSTIKTEPFQSEVSIKDLLLNNKYDWILFSSENGVKYFFQNLYNNKLDSRILSNIKIGTIGKATSKFLENYGLFADFIPSKYTSNDFVNEFSNKYDVSKLKILRIKGNFENDLLAIGLIQKGAIIFTYQVYNIIKEYQPKEKINDLIKFGADVFMFTSSSTVNNFFDIVNPENAINLLKGSIVVSIGPMTTETLNKNGINNIIEAKEQTVDGMVQELLRYI